MKNEYFENLDDAIREDLSRQLEAHRDTSGNSAAFWRALLAALIESGTETRLDELESFSIQTRDENDEDEILNEGEFWLHAVTHSRIQEDLNLDGIIDEVAARFGFDIIDKTRDGEFQTWLIGSERSGEAARRYAVIDTEDGAVWGAFDIIEDARTRKSDGDIIFDREAGKEVA